MPHKCKRLPSKLTELMDSVRYRRQEQIFTNRQVHRNRRKFVFVHGRSPFIHTHTYVYRYIVRMDIIKSRRSHRSSVKSFNKRRRRSPVYFDDFRGEAARNFSPWRGQQQAEVSRVANSSLRFVNIRNLSARGSPSPLPNRVFGKRQVALTNPINPSLAFLRTLAKYFLPPRQIFSAVGLVSF